MVKETVKITDGSEREVEVIQILSLEVKYDALDAATKTKVNVKKKDSDVEVNMGALITHVLRHQVKGAKPAEIDAEDGERIFTEYFGKYFSDSTNDKGDEVVVEGDVTNPPMSDGNLNES